MAFDVYGEDGKSGRRPGTEDPHRMRRDARTGVWNFLDDDTDEPIMDEPAASEPEPIDDENVVGTQIPIDQDLPVRPENTVDAGEKLRSELAPLLARLDAAIDLISVGTPEKARQRLLAKWAVLVDYAKKFGRNDYAVAQALQGLIVAEVILNKPEGMSAIHEMDDSTGFYDVHRIFNTYPVQQDNEYGVLSHHPAMEDAHEVHPVGTPVPLFNPGVTAALRGSLDTTLAHQDDYSEYDYPAPQEFTDLWRTAAQAEYLSAMTKILRAGVDVRAITAAVFNNTSKVDVLVTFLEVHSVPVPKENSTPEFFVGLAEQWEEKRKKAELLPSVIQDSSDRPVYDTAAQSGAPVDSQVAA